MKRLFTLLSNLVFVVGYALADNDDYGRSYSVEDGNSGIGSTILGLLLLGGLYALFCEISTPGKDGKDRTCLGCVVVIAIMVILSMIVKACR